MSNDDDHPLKVVDPTGLTDAEWAEINKLRQAWDSGGSQALSEAMGVLALGDPVRGVRVLGALFPHEVSELIKDQLAERGITKEDLQELMRSLEDGTKH